MRIPHCTLYFPEIQKLEGNIDPEWIELDIDKEIKLVKKVLIPQFRYPRFNFVGKIIGPKAQTLQNLAKSFKCHVYVLGRGSTRDRAKVGVHSFDYVIHYNLFQVQELLASGVPNFAHYSGPLHVKIETTATPALAYKRIAGVMEVLKKLLEPVRDTFIEGITPAPEAGNGDDKNGDGDGDEPKEKKEEERSQPPNAGVNGQEYAAPPRGRGGPRGGGSRRPDGGKMGGGLHRGGGPGGRGGGPGMEHYRGPAGMRGGGRGAPRGFDRGGMRGGRGGGGRFQPY